MIDPTIWADEDFGRLSYEEMILFIGMISNADDKGRLPGNALYLASTILPYKGLTTKQATVIRDNVVSIMSSVILYTIDGKEYIQLKNWLSYQSINKAHDSKYPPLPEDYGSDTVALPPNRIEEKRKEEKKKETEKEKSGDSPSSVYVTHFNSLFGKSYTVTNGRTQKLKARLENYSIEQILTALSNLSKSEFHHGKNDRRWEADPDFLIRNDETVDKWLNNGVKLPVAKPKSVLDELIP